jgi:hypothetical protein
MLHRRQANAVVAAQSRIVEVAVGMVELALERLDERGSVNLDQEHEAAIVSNLMVVVQSPTGVANRQYWHALLVSRE